MVRAQLVGGKPLTRRRHISIQQVQSSQSNLNPRKGASDDRFYQVMSKSTRKLKALLDSSEVLQNIDHHADTSIPHGFEWRGASENGVSIGLR